MSASKINEELKTALTRAEAIYRENFERKPWDYKLWAQLYDQKAIQSTFDSFCEKVIAKLYTMNKAGTAVYYSDSLKAIQKFLGKKRIAFEEINKSALKDFIARAIMETGQ